jgi:hypothetical protein
MKELAAVLLGVLGWWMFYRQGAVIMAKLDDVNAKIDAIGAAVAELAREIGVLVSAGPGPVSQAQLDELDAKLTAVLDAAKSADPNP